MSDVLFALLIIGGLTLGVGWVTSSWLGAIVGFIIGLYICHKIGVLNLDVSRED